MLRQMNIYLVNLRLLHDILELAPRQLNVADRASGESPSSPRDEWKIFGSWNVDESCVNVDLNQWIKK